MHTVIAAVPAI